jgi:hypothetical protein
MPSNDEIVFIEAEALGEAVVALRTPEGRRDLATGKRINDLPDHTVQGLYEVHRAGEVAVEDALDSLIVRSADVYWQARATGRGCSPQPARTPRYGKTYTESIG